MNADDVLLALSVKREGNYSLMISDIKKKVPLTHEEMQAARDLTKANFLTIVDHEYPSCFTMIENPPLILYYYGNFDLLNKPYRLTVVGTRQPTVYQEDTTYKMIQEVEEKTKNRVIICSGMAKGIDQAAMKAAMDVGAPVISIIGSGIDNPYPSENQELYEYCKSDKGLVLSEYPLSQQAKPENFLFRNRLLAAVSQVLFVGGGKSHSGTSATVRYALDDNRDVYALPCNVSGNDLTNSLIQEGAYSALSSMDLIEGLISSYGLGDDMKSLLSKD